MTAKQRAQKKKAKRQVRPAAKGKGKKSASKKTPAKSSGKRGRPAPAGQQIDLLAVDGDLPSDLSVPAALIAQLFEVTQARVRQLADLNVIVKMARDRYALQASVQGYCRYLKRLRDDSERKRHEETRLTKVRADSVELELAVKSRKLYDAEVVDQAFFAVCTQLTAMLDGSASRIASVLGGGATLRTKLVDEFHEIRVEFAAGLREFSERVSQGGWNNRPAAKPRARKVGKKKPRAAKRKRRARAV